MQKNALDTKVVSKAWGELLDNIKQNKLTREYIEKKTLTDFSTLKFEHFYDYLGRNLFQYAIIYKNKVLVDFMVDKIDYLRIEKKPQKKFLKSIMTEIRYLCSNIDKNIEFLSYFFHITAQKIDSESQDRLHFKGFLEGILCNNNI